VLVLPEMPSQEAGGSRVGRSARQDIRWVRRPTLGIAMNEGIGLYNARYEIADPGQQAMIITRA